MQVKTVIPGTVLLQTFGQGRRECLAKHSKLAAVISLAIPVVVILTTALFSYNQQCGDCIFSFTAYVAKRYAITYIMAVVLSICWGFLFFRDALASLQSGPCAVWVQEGSLHLLDAKIALNSILEISYFSNKKKFLIKTVDGNVKKYQLCGFIYKVNSVLQDSHASQLR